MVVGVTMIVGLFMNCLFCCRLRHFVGMMMGFVTMVMVGIFMIMVVIVSMAMLTIFMVMLLMMLVLMPLQIDIHALLFLPVDRHLHMCSCDSALY